MLHSQHSVHADYGRIVSFICTAGDQQPAVIAFHIFAHALQLLRSNHLQSSRSKPISKAVIEYLQSKALHQSFGHFFGLCSSSPPWNTLPHVAALYSGLEMSSPTQLLSTLLFVFAAYNPTGATRLPVWHDKYLLSVARELAGTTVQGRRNVLTVEAALRILTPVGQPDPYEKVTGEVYMVAGVLHLITTGGMGACTLSHIMKGGR